MKTITNEEMAKAWEVAAGYLDFTPEWEPNDGTPEDAQLRIINHIQHVIQPFLYNKAKIIHRNAKLGPRRK